MGSVLSYYYSTSFSKQELLQSLSERNSSVWSQFKKITFSVSVGPVSLGHVEPLTAPGHGEDLAALVYAHLRDQRPTGRHRDYLAVLRAQQNLTGNRSNMLKQGNLNHEREITSEHILEKIKSNNTLFSKEDFEREII